MTCYDCSAAGDMHIHENYWGVNLLTYLHVCSSECPSSYFSLLFIGVLSAFLHHRVCVCCSRICTKETRASRTDYTRPIRWMKLCKFWRRMERYQRSVTLSGLAISTQSFVHRSCAVLCTWPLNLSVRLTAVGCGLQQALESEIK